MFDESEYTTGDTENDHNYEDPHWCSVLLLEDLCSLLAGGCRIIRLNVRDRDSDILPSQGIVDEIIFSLNTLPDLLTSGDVDPFLRPTVVLQRVIAKLISSGLQIERQRVVLAV